MSHKHLTNKNPTAKYDLIQTSLNILLFTLTFDARLLTPKNTSKCYAGTSKLGILRRNMIGHKHLNTLHSG